MEISEITYLIIFGTIAFLIFLIFIILVVYRYHKKNNQHLRQMLEIKQSYEQTLLKTQLETQEQTFNQISRELHDNVGQLLSSTKMFLSITERSMQNPPDSLITANETLAQAIKELRSLSKSLDKEWLEQFNFIENLTTETNRINAADGLHIYCSHPVSLSLKPELQIVLFRIVQEILHNAIKHAEAKNIHINITQNASGIHISISDDGKGFDIENRGLDGSGINNIKHRTQMLGGTVQWQSISGNGTGIIIALPIQTEI